jgi:hypothetical protein
MILPSILDNYGDSLHKMAFLSPYGGGLGLGEFVQTFVILCAWAEFLCCIRVKIESWKLGLRFIHVLFLTSQRFRIGAQADS